VLKCRPSLDAREPIGQSRSRLLPHLRHAQHIQATNVWRHRDVRERETVACQPRLLRKRLFHLAQIAIVESVLVTDARRVETQRNELLLTLVPLSRCGSLAGALSTL
jgi:hypothetical protein